jgi:hypothetical protein
MKTSMILAPLAFASAAVAAPVTRDQLLSLAREKVDPAVMRAIVVRDCVDFDVDAGNVGQLSRVVPAAVLEAAIECRRVATPSPAAAVAPAHPAGTAPAPPAADPVATPTRPAAVVEPAAPASRTLPAATGAPAPASEPSPAVAPVPVPPAPAPAVPAGPSKIRLRAIFIGETDALRCTASIDGVEAATFLKEAQGKFGESVARDPIGRETAYLPVRPGSHRVVFRCDPKDQTVEVDVDVPAGETRTVEIGETTLRNWKLRRIRTP